MITYHKWTGTSLSFLRGAIWLSILAFLLLGMAVHRVRADQTSSTPVADTFVSSGKPAESFASNSGLWVGYGRPGGYSEERSLLGFDTAAIPRWSKITSATLKLYLPGTTSGDTPLAIQACRVSSNWLENITWNGYLGLTVDCTSAASTNVPATLGWYPWDVTAALQAWSDNRDTSNFSLLLKSDVTSGQHYRGFWSRDCSTADCGSNRPYLDIAYDPPTPTPTATSTRTATPTATPDVPRLRATLQQRLVGSNRLQYDIVVENISSKPAYQVIVTNQVPGATSVVQILDGGYFQAGPPARIIWQPGTLTPGATVVLRYVVQMAGIQAGASEPGAAPGLSAEFPLPQLTVESRFYKPSETPPPPLAPATPPSSGATTPEIGAAPGNATAAIVAALRAGGRPVIDGDLTEWAGLASVPLDALGHYSAVTGPLPSLADLSATLRAVWTSDTLYFAAAITDDVLIGNDSIDIWQDDVIELALYIAAASRSHQFSLCVDGRQADQGTLINSLVVGRRFISGGWTVEVAIPIAVLGSGALAAGQQYPFTFALWDDDVGAGSRGQTHLFWQGNDTYSYQSDWGTLSLSSLTYDFATPTPTPTRTSTPTATSFVPI